MASHPEFDLELGVAPEALALGRPPETLIPLSVSTTESLKSVRPEMDI